ncbi:hypothetical protein [Pelagibaculum spongiae]|uniref:Uncharacterized protein n=1 Tax=Pelagibaculum spongiae TaxID=2080658 RepID=A0A2V1GWG9_9GAMM|nr:hypothetical protein [Pelagibaculum spongiae]PVZ69017.1 hypothetical protein DC094_12295 [Pelagibaculum spongiae]
MKVFFVKNASLSGMSHDCVFLSLAGGGGGIVSDRIKCLIYNDRKYLGSFLYDDTDFLCCSGNLGEYCAEDECSNINYSLKELPTALAKAFLSWQDRSDLNGLFYRDSGKVSYISFSDYCVFKSDVKSGLHSTQVHDFYIKLDRVNKSLSSYGRDLKKLWEQRLDIKYFFISAERFLAASFAESSFIAMLGHRSSQKIFHLNQLGKPTQLNVFSNSEIASFALKDGQQNWSHITKYTIDGWQLLEEQVFLATSNGVEVLDAHSGKELRQIDFGWDNHYWQADGAGLYVSEQYVIYGHSFQKKLLILDRFDLSLIRDVELPEHWFPQARFKPFYHQHSNKLYLNLKTDQLVAENQVLLEIDLADIHAPVVFENEPEFEICQIPSSENSQWHSIEINCSDPAYDDDFDTVLRFADRHCRDQAYIHATCTLTKHFSRHKDSVDEKFDGKVYFNYQGKQKDTDLVQQRLVMMEKRFSRWVEDEEASSINGYCQLITNCQH